MAPVIEATADQAPTPKTSTTSVMRPSDMWRAADQREVTS